MMNSKGHERSGQIIVILWHFPIGAEENHKEI